LDQTLTLKFLDQCGFCLMMTLCYTWFKRGTGLAFEVPTRWGSQGRINLIGTLSFFGEQETLEIRELNGSCTGEQVIAYLETLATSCDPSKPTTVVMDNAAFHKGVALKARQADWEAGGLLLRYLPAYCPCLNLIEGVWRRVKGFLMPRRCYNSVVELRAALLVALKALGAVMV
jgi:putative transposase